MPIELNRREYNNGRNASVFELAAPGLLGGYGYDGYAAHATSSIKADARTPSIYQCQAQANHAVCSPSSASEKDEFEEDGMSTPMAIRPTVAAAVATVSPGPGDDTNIPTKPMRPLTSYHMYFQLEREFILQGMDGDDTEKSMNDHKVYLDYVPERYRNIKLSPQWYFGPGKRQKRKHRKQHGKIGFMELSRMISERWAKLEESDPEVKKFVHKVAKQELEEYQREMKTYKELVERKANAANKSNDMAKKRAHPETYSMPPNQHTPLMSASSPHQSLMNKSMQLRHKIDQLKYEIAQREIEQLKNELAYVNSCVSMTQQRYIAHPMPTQPSTSEPPKKKFFRRRISNQPVSATELFKNPEMSGNSDPALSSQANFGNFYRRQSSNLSLSFLDPMANELKRSETFAPGNPALPDLK